MGESSKAAFPLQDAYACWRNASGSNKVDLLEDMLEAAEPVSLVRMLSQDFDDLKSQMDLAALLFRTPFFQADEAPGSVEVVASYYYRVSGGGIESSMVSLAHTLGLERRSLIIAGDDCGTVEDRAGVDGVSLISYQERGHDRFQALSCALAEYAVDTLIHHAWFDRNLLWDVLLCRLQGIRVVLNQHGCFSHFLNVTDGTLVSWNDGRLFCLVPRIVSLCSAVVSETAVNKRFFQCFNRRAYEVRNELPRDLRDQARLRTCKLDDERCADEHIVLWVGRFDIYKHPEDAIRVFAKVHETDPSARLVMVGESGYSTYEVELAKLAAELGIAAFVDFAGFHKNVRPYYERASVMLLTSEIEGYCMVLAEACAHGLPIVAYDLPYLPFAQCEGIVWVPQANVDQAAREVSSLLSDAVEASRLGSLSANYIASEERMRSEDNWDDVFGDFSVGRYGNACAVGSCDGVVWDTLFGHYIKGADRTHDQIVLRDAQIAHLQQTVNEGEAALAACREEGEAALAACREEYERSLSYRIGHALLALPRFIVRRICPK